MTCGNATSPFNVQHRARQTLKTGYHIRPESSCSMALYNCRHFWYQQEHDGFIISVDKIGSGEVSNECY